MWWLFLSIFFTYNAGTMLKLLLDYFPIVAFFVAFKWAGIFVATAVTMLATIVQIGLVWWHTRRLEPMHWVTLALVWVLGGSTLLLHDVRFIQWKPTLIYWVFSSVLFFTHFFRRKTLLESLMDSHLSLPRGIWRRFNLTWALFFLSLGGVNLFFAYRYSLAVWVDFKLFGTLGATLLLMMIQGIYLWRRHRRGLLNISGGK